MEQVTQNQLKRQGPKKEGPLTKDQWDKVRPRFDDKDDFF